MKEMLQERDKIMWAYFFFRKNQNYNLHKVNRKKDYVFSEGEDWVNSAVPVKEMLQERDKIMWVYLFFSDYNSIEDKKFMEQKYI